MNFGRIIQKDCLKYYEVADNVFAVISENKGLSHSNAGFINRGKGMVVDTFQGIQYARELRKFCVEQSGRLPAYVVNTHADADHVWGNQVFEFADIIMHKNAVWEGLNYNPEVFREMFSKPESERNVGEQWLYDQCGDLDLTMVAWTPGNMFIEKDTTIMLGETEVQLLNFAPSHSNSDLIIWLPKERVLWAGDIVFEGGGYVCYSAPGMKLWVDALDRIVNELKPEVIIPGHGGICDCKEVKLSRQYFTYLMDEFERLYDDDISALEMCKKIDISPYIAWLQPERLFTNINTLVNHRRGIVKKPDWTYFAIEMAKLKEFQESKYTIPVWDSMSSWKE